MAHPTEDVIYNDVSKIVDELGVEIVTMKVLRKRLEAQYGCSLEDQKEVLNRAIEKKFCEPKTQLAVQKASAQESVGKVNPGRKKRKLESGPSATVKKNEKCGPKRPQSAYFFFVGQNRQKIMNEHPGIKVTEISVKAGELWKALSEPEKKNYNELAAQDKKRYEDELNEFKEGGGIVTKKSKKTHRCDKNDGPAPPKRPQSAYFLYLNANRDSFVKSQSTKLSGPEVVKRLAEQWRELGPDEKKPYLAEESKLKDMYTDAMRLFKEQHPDVGKHVKKVTTSPSSKRIKTTTIHRKKKDNIIIDDEDISEHSSRSRSPSSDSSNSSSSGKSLPSSSNSDESDSNSSENSDSDSSSD